MKLDNWDCNCNNASNCNIECVIIRFGKIIDISRDEINYANAIIQHNEIHKHLNHEDFVLLWGKSKNALDRDWVIKEVEFTPLVQINPKSPVGYTILKHNNSIKNPAKYNFE